MATLKGISPSAPSGPSPTSELAPEGSDRLKELEADNERLRELATAAARLAEFGRFAAEQNHELRQPLLAIKGLAQLMLASDPIDPKEARESAQLIVEQADRMARLISELKHLSSPRRRRESGPLATEIGPIVRRAAAILEYRTRQRATLVLDLADTVPPAAASADEVEQIVINLMANAIDAVAHGGRDGARGVIQVRVRRAPHGGATPIEICVADNGAGISAETRAHLFEAFFTTKGDNAGTGLGLSVSREIARGLGGDLTLLADPGTWPHAAHTVFCLTLPASTR